jgi:hypothetical protein
MQNSTDGANSPIETTPNSFAGKIRHRARRLPAPLASLGAAAAITVAGVGTAFAASGPAPAPAPAPAAAPAAAAVPAQAPAPSSAPAPTGGAAPDSPAVQDRIVKLAQAEVGTREHGDNCQKYSPQCVSWCGLFATSMWEHAGVNVDHEQFAFTGNIYKQGQASGTAYDAQHLDQAKPGDVLLYGTGPDSPKTSKHVGLVESRSGNTVTMIEGNSGPGAKEVHRSVHQLGSGEYYGGVHPWDMRK